MCGGMFVIHLTANLLRNLPVKKFLNRLRFDRIMVTSLWSRFLAHPVGGINELQLEFRVDTCLAVRLLIHTRADKFA